MPRRRDIILVLAAVACLVALGLGIAWATGRPEVARHALHLLHFLIAFKVLKWMAAGCLLAVLIVRRLVNSKSRETSVNPASGAVVRLPGCAPEM